MRSVSARPLQFFMVRQCSILRHFDVPVVRIAANLSMLFDTHNRCCMGSPSVAGSRRRSTRARDRSSLRRPPCGRRRRAAPDLSIVPRRPDRPRSVRTGQPGDPSDKPQARREHRRPRSSSFEPTVSRGSEPRLHQPYDLGGPSTFSLAAPRNFDFGLDWFTQPASQTFMRSAAACPSCNLAQQTVCERQRALTSCLTVSDGGSGMLRFCGPVAGSRTIHGCAGALGSSAAARAGRAGARNTSCLCIFRQYPCQSSTRSCHRDRQAERLPG
jgi:hypothetical protein